MGLKLDYTNMLFPVCEAGLKQEDLSNLKNAVERIRKEIKEKKEEFGYLNLPFSQQNVVKEILEYVKENKDKYENFVVLGIGGSALGNLATFQALRDYYHNYLPQEKRNGTRLFVMDNVEPHRLHNLFQLIDPKKTLFNVITKSGTTAETMSNFMVVYQFLKEHLTEEELSNQIIATTDPEKGILLEMAKEYGWKTFFIPQNVGGRFSVFSPVGLLSSAFCGIDIEKILVGAREMVEKGLNSEFFANPVSLLASLLYLNDQKHGKSMVVMMSYSDKLYGVTDWFRQLWAESLGKKYSKDGRIVQTGTTPIKALGTTDQHSQVQLYNEGPKDKVIVFLKIENHADDLEIKNAFGQEKLAYLDGKKLSSLLNYECDATSYAVTKNGVPNLTLKIDRLTEENFGKVILLWEMVTHFVGELYGINTFDQPGVEMGKEATYGLMGRKGYEKIAEEIKSFYSSHQSQHCDF